MTSSEKTVPELYEMAAKDYEKRAQDSRDPELKAYNAACARDYRLRANHWRRILTTQAGAAS